MALVCAVGLSCHHDPLHAQMAQPSTVTPAEAVEMQKAGKQPAPSFTSAMADPLLRDDAIFQANKSATWEEGQTSYILLEGEASFYIGNFGFRGERMLIRMDRENKPGLPIKHLGIYIDQAKALPGKGPISAESGRLLVTASTTGKQRIKTFLLNKNPVLNDPFVNDGKGRINRYYAALNQPTLPVPPGGPMFTQKMRDLRAERRAEIRQERYDADYQAIEQIANSGKTKPTAIETQPATMPGMAATPEQQAGIVIDPETGKPVELVKDNSILPKSSQLLFVADKYVAEPGKPGEYNLVLQGQARLMYIDKQNRVDATLSADRVVVFIKSDALSDVTSRKIDSSKILGLYLEDNVIVTVNDYTIRAPRVYYDNQFNKATILEAVMYAYDIKRQLPIYLRAQQLRQESRTTWSANDATMTTSAFYEPHISLAAKRLTFNVESAVPEAEPGLPGEGVEKSQPKGTAAVASATAPALQGGDPQGAGSGATGAQTQPTGSAGAAASMSALGFAPVGDGVAGAAPRYTFTAKDAQIKFGEVPIFVWPELKGDATMSTPNRGVQVGYSNRRGPLIETRWDVFALSGLDPIDGISSNVNFDYMGRNGPGIGMETDWQTADSFGTFRGYLLAYDTGYDKIGNRNDVDFDGAQRGFIDFKHRELLSEYWQASFELGYAGGKTFLERFFPEEAAESKPYETSVYLKRQQADSAFTFLAKYDINNAKQQTTTLQTPGYTVDKLPELGYYRIGKSLWNDRLTYFTENRLSYMKARPGTDSPSDRGFTNQQSLDSFGFAANMSWDQYYESIGVPDRNIARLDSRHEIVAPFKLSFVDFAPYAAGRVTAYDSEFRDYLNNGQYNQYRLWGSVGTRISTKFSRSYDSVESSMLDLKRMNHIIEPNVDLFMTGSTIPDDTIPIYDPDVEGLQNSSGFKLGLRNTLQTQRGGPGRQRSVDWLVLNTDYIKQNSLAQDNQTLARYFSYQPEYSTGGDHFYTNALWLISDSLAASGELTYNMEDDYVAQYRGGLTMQHDASLSSFIDYNKIDRIDQDLLGFGLNYKLTPKYHVTFRQTYDFDFSQLRGTELSLVRKLQQFRVVVIARYDAINDETVFGFSLIPDGLAGDRKYLNPFNAGGIPQ